MHFTRKCFFKFFSPSTQFSPLAYLLNIVFNSIICPPPSFNILCSWMDAWFLPILHCYSFNRVSIHSIAAAAVCFKVIGNSYRDSQTNIHNNETFQPSGEFNIPGSFIAHTYTMKLLVPYLMYINGNI